jgi:replicative DNA helicase
LKHLDAVIELQAIKTICDSPNKMLLLSRVNDEFFGSDQAKEIFRRVSHIVGQGKDVPSSEVLKTDVVLSESSRAFLANKSALHIESPDDIDHLFEGLARYRKARLLLDLITSSIEVLKENDPDVDTVVDSIESTLQKCRTGSVKSEMKHFTNANADQLLKEINEDLSDVKDDFIPTSFAEFDKSTGGFRRKNVIALASTPGGGKSAMALQMAINQYLMGYNVCYVSYEMDEVEMRYRALSNISQIDHGDINLKRLNKKKIATINAKFREFLNTGKDNRLTLWCPERELNIPEIAAELKAYNYDVIYIDYIQLLKPYPNKALWESLGDHARASKLAANALNTAFIILAQYDDKENKLKYSKAIMANAHFVWAWESGQKELESGIIEVKQLKARNAQVFPFYLQRDFKTMTFKDCTAPVPPPPGTEPPKKPKTEIPKMPELS